MSDTPRTDAECRKPENAGRVNGVLPTEFARQLERELVASERTLQECHRQHTESCLSNIDLRARAEKAEQENLEHAEDWAMCGLAPSSQTVKLLVLSDENRKLRAKLEQAHCALREDIISARIIAAENAGRNYGITRDTRFIEDRCNAAIAASAKLT